MHVAELNAVWRELIAPGAVFEVAETEVRGVRLRAFRNAPADLRAVWLATAAYGQRRYLVYEDERLTYTEAHRQVASIAGWLHDWGVGRGDRIAIAMRNYPEWLLIAWAALSLGVGVVGMNAWWTVQEMAFALADAQPRVLFADDERLARLAEEAAAADGLALVAVRSDGHGFPVVPFAEIVAVERPLPEARIDPEDDACIFYTSGTTGFPKGAQMTHRSCVNNLMNIAFSVQVQSLATQRAAAKPAPAPTPPVTLVTTPLFHVTGCTCAAFSNTMAGGTIVLMRKWDATQALALVARERVTAVAGVPTMSRELITHPDFGRYDTSSLQTLGGGGSQLHPDLINKIDATLVSGRPNTGYGMTEASGIITAVAGDYLTARPETCGRAMPTFETRIVDEEGRDLPIGAVGELLVRGASVIKGYINRPEATAEAITDGWLRTGDVARIDDDGFIFLVDRKKDMVLRGGENVYCAEVEGCLHAHPDVAECCVFGVPDSRLGEEVAAAVVPRTGASLTAEGLRTHCAARIARYKAPRYIWILDRPLPRNATGKFLKRLLRDSLTLETGV